MSKPTNYEMLKDIYLIMGRLETKLNEKINLNTKKIDSIESKTDNLLGKMGIGVIIMSAFISTGIALAIGAVKKVLKIA